MFKFRFIVVMGFFFLLLVACSTPEEPVVVEATQPPATVVVPTVASTAAPTEAPVEAEPEVLTLESFVQGLQTAVTNQDYAAMQMMMSETIAVGGWRSEWRMYEPTQTVAEFQNDSLPAPTAVQFTGLTDQELTNLLGQSPASMFGPTSTVVTALHSTGWGAEGSDEAILFVIEEDGRYAWSAFLYTFGTFAQETTETTTESSDTFPVVETDVNYVQAQQNVVMYSGPGDTYEEIGGVADGQTALVTGQSEDGNWWRVICPDDTVGDCWITADPAITFPTNP